MTSFAGALRSTLGRKYLMGITGLIWVGFVIGHLIGNLLIYLGREPFNRYAYFLETLGHGWLLPVVELALVVVLLTHVWNGITIAMNRGVTRPDAYAMSGNAGGKSRKGLASQTMIWTGLMILGFLVLHIATFKFAVGAPPIKPYLIDGQERLDLYEVVVWRFSNGAYAGFYTFVMLLLGMHLKHGVWSGLQSLGLLTRKTLPVAQKVAFLLAVLLAVGFLLLPASVFLMNDTFATPVGGLFHK